MKISHDNNVGLVDKFIKTTNNKTLKEKAVTVNKSANTLDKVELSDRKNEIEKIAEKIKSMPVVRQERVDQIREAIKSETYNVKGELIAQSMLKSHLIDEIL